MCAQSGKIPENVRFYTKTNLLYCPIPSAPKSQILWGRYSRRRHGERSQPPAFNFRRPKSRKRRKRPSGRPVEDRSAGWSLLEGQRSVPFPPEHYFKGESTAHQRELRRKEEGGTLVTYHRSKSSPLKLNSCCSVCLAFLSRKEGKKTRIIHRALCATRPHTVRSGLSRLWGEKCTRERGGGKRTAFLPPPFSSLRFQAAVQLCGSLLQATPAPTEPTGWSSSALQSQKPTAGS